MALRMAERLHLERRRRFVGRAGERRLFQAALAADDLPFYVLHVHGPGGVGKTTLLGELVALCEQAQIPTVALDARAIEPSPEAFLEALRSAMGLAADEPPDQALIARAGRHVLLIDTYERLAPLDGWLREVFLPALPMNTLVVLAGRQSPTAAWRTDPGWQALVRALPLAELSAEESREYLTRRNVPLAQQDAILDFTRGYPLALSLVADVFAQRGDVRFAPESAPDVVKLLLERLVQHVPGPAHRAALEVCALVRTTTEALLADVLAMPDAHELFAWLRGLSFVESGRLGIFPHDLAREALAADVRWRNPDWYRELHRRAGAYYGARLKQSPDHEQERILGDYIFLHRDNPIVRPFFAHVEQHGGGGALTDVAREHDWPVLLAMVAQHEGDESARIAALWFKQQPGAVRVVRSTEAGSGLRQAPKGLLVTLPLHQASADDLAADPAALAAWRYLQAHAPLRPGEGATFFRFWMAADTYQAISSVQSLIFVNVVRHYLTTPGLAYTLLPCAEPDVWAGIFAYADLQRLPEADFVVDGRRYGVYGHDWRVRPPLAWLKLLAERETAADGPAVPAPTPDETVVVLGQTDFARAVREALRDYCRPDALLRCPLLRARVVVQRAGATAGPAARAEVLRVLLTEVARPLQAAPRSAKLYRALDHTYFHPAASQEQAAELLDLPFSTFRRHLHAGVAHVTEMLWQQELGAPPA